MESAAVPALRHRPPCSWEAAVHVSLVSFHHRQWSRTDQWDAPRSLWWPCSSWQQMAQEGDQGQGQWLNHHPSVLAGIVKEDFNSCISTFYLNQEIMGCSKYILFTKWKYLLLKITWNTDNIPLLLTSSCLYPSFLYLSSYPATHIALKMYTFFHSFRNLSWFSNFSFHSFHYFMQVLAHCYQHKNVTDRTNDIFGSSTT